MSSEPISAGLLSTPFTAPVFRLTKTYGIPVGELNAGSRRVAEIVGQLQQALVAGELITAEQPAQQANGDLEILDVDVLVERELLVDELAVLCRLRPSGPSVPWCPEHRRASSAATSSGVQNRLCSRWWWSTSRDSPWSAGGARRVPRRIACSRPRREENPGERARPSRISVDRSIMRVRCGGGIARRCVLSKCILQAKAQLLNNRDGERSQ